jgi:hypothetical protein
MDSISELGLWYATSRVGERSEPRIGTLWAQGRVTDHERDGV